MRHNQDLPGVRCDIYDGTTASGVHSGYGLVAVDPRVFPLGTHFHIPGYGNAVAADTGGAIKGHIIDLAVTSCRSAIYYGRRKQYIAYR